MYDNNPKSEGQAKRFFYSMKEDSDFNNEEDGLFDQLEYTKIHLKKFFTQFSISDAFLTYQQIQLYCTKEASLQRLRQQQQEFPRPSITEADFERRMNDYDNYYHGLIDFYLDLKLNLPEVNIIIIEIDSMGKKMEDFFRQAKDKIFHYYKYLDYLYVSEDNEKALIEKLQKQEEQKTKEEEIMKKQQAEQAAKLKQKLALEKKASDIGGFGLSYLKQLF